ncbi:MAG: CAP domain-containing protein [Betaproteobacteria bacterium]
MAATERQCLTKIALVCALTAFALFASVAPAAAAGAEPEPAWELGEAPRQAVPQGIAPDASVSKFSSRIEAAATSRDSVVQLYNTVYLPGNLVGLTWSGSVAGCVVGSTNAAHQQAVIDRVNYYRSLVDLPTVTLLTGLPTTQSQSAALMMSANNSLSHSPPAGWTCYSADGATGASKSNLSLGINGVGAIDGYMEDPGAGNIAAGHRRWILYPPQVSMATGDVPNSGPSKPSSNDLYVLGSFGTRPPTPNGVAWPPAGYVPFPNLPSGSNRWSLSYPGANFASATVTMTGPNGPTSIPVSLEALQNDIGYADNTIVFKPASFNYGNPGVDAAYTILVSGLTGAGVPASIQYTVTVIDPALPAGSTPSLVGAASRKVHGGAGTFDLALSNVPANPTTEPRSSAVQHLIVFTFDKPVTGGNASVTEGVATAGAPTFSGSEMRVPLTAVTDRQYVSVAVSNVVAADGGTGGSASIRVGYLLGDVNQNRVVTLSDLGMVNAQVAQVVSAANYLKDVNASGTLTLTDKGLTNAQLTKALPAP